MGPTLETIVEKAVEMVKDVASRLELPDDSGEKKYSSELPDDSGEAMPESLDKLISDYQDDLREKSEYPETLSDNLIDKNTLEKVSPEAVAEKREEFVEKKPELKREWEENYGISWPQYTEDIYSQNGKLIRKAGSDYDAHHIQPLCMGGENVAQNITPMHASVHFDKQGIHAPNSPYSKLEQQLGG